MLRPARVRKRSVHVPAPRGPSNAFLSLPPGRLHPTSPLSASAHQPGVSRHLRSFSRRCSAIPTSRLFSSSISRRTTPVRWPLCSPTIRTLAVLEATEGARVAAEPRVRGAAQHADGAHRRPSAPWPPPRGSQPVQPDRFLLSVARASARRACNRRRAVGHGIGRRARDSEIKTMEGITFAQDPSTAKYDGMPKAAIATRMVDIVASPADIASKADTAFEASVSHAIATSRIRDRRSRKSSFAASSGCCFRPAGSISRTTRRRRLSAVSSGAWRCYAWSTRRLHHLSRANARRGRQSAQRPADPRHEVLSGTGVVRVHRA